MLFLKGNNMEQYTLDKTSFCYNQINHKKNKNEYIVQALKGALTVNIYPFTLKKVI